jgi:hypothetical protein
MSKTILPNIDKVKELYNRDPEKFIRRYRKADVLMGEVESVEWVESKLQEYYERNIEKQD